MSNEEFEHVEFVNDVFNKRGENMFSTWQKRYLKICPLDHLHDLAILYLDSDVELLEAIVIEIEDRNAKDKLETSRVLKDRGVD